MTIVKESHESKTRQKDDFNKLKEQENYEKV